MTYTPNNTPVYLKAFAGFLSGITAVVTTNTIPDDFTAYAQQADAYAQQFDTSWGVGAVTALELSIIEEGSEAVWRNRSPLTTAPLIPSSYTQIVESVIARVQQGHAQVVSEGVNPNDSNISVGIAASVPDAAALADISVTNLQIGAVAFVGVPGAITPSFCAYFSLRSSAGLALNSATILVSSNDDFVWVRTLTAVAETAQTQPAWNFNAETGNDENSGLTSNTALKTYGEYIRRVGGLTTTITQDTTFTWGSDDPELSDPIVFTPIITNGARVVLTGSPSVLGTVEINGSGFQAKDRAAGAQLRVNLTGLGAAGQLVINTTHPSRAWAKQSIGVDVFVLDQPFSGSQFTAAEVDSWATTDVVQLVTVPRVNIITIAPTWTGPNKDEDNLVQVNLLIAGDPQGVGFSPLAIGPYVVLTDVRAEKFFCFPNLDEAGYTALWTNVGADGTVFNFQVVQEGNNVFGWNGGHIVASSFGVLCTSGIDFDGDVIIDCTGLVEINAQIGNASIGFANIVGGTIGLIGRLSSMASGGFGGGAFWGTSNIDVQRDANLRYEGNAIDRFLTSGAMTIGGSSTACSQSGSGVVTIHNNINITPANLDEVAGATGFGGTAFQLSGGTITKQPSL